jgi:pilus assembly protein FimV
MTFSVNQTGDGSSDAMIFSGTRVRLPGFVVFAPPNSASVTYVSADLTLDFSNTEIAAVIKENEAFVRDIIYGTISNELMTRDISAIDEASMELAIRKALGRIVAREAISRIAFDRFSLV